jgi:ABC-type transport system involved in multi-copper enzyme maturation permease subunit
VEAINRSLAARQRTRAVAAFIVWPLVVVATAALVFLAFRTNPVLGCAALGFTAVGLAWAHRRGWWTFIGPVFFFEMVRTGRQLRNNLIRISYALVIYGLLLFTYILCLIFANVAFSNGFVSSRLPSRLMDDFLLAFSAVFLLLQYIAALLLTPAYLAGAIAEERDRNALDALLATDLRDREIALGIVLPRFIHLLLIFMVGMPIISGLQFLGGVDPNLVIAGYVGFGLTTVSIAALSIVCSLYARQSRSALLRAYGLVFGYFLLSGLTWLLIWPLDLGTFPSTDTWTSPVTVRDIVDWCNAGNGISIAFEMAVGVGRGRPLHQLLFPALRDYAWFHGMVTILCLTWVGLRFRALLLAPSREAVRPAKGQGSGTAWLFGLNGRPPVFNRPMYWKEIYVEGAPWRPLLRTLRLGIRLAIFATPLLWCIYYYGGFRAFNSVEEARDLINLWVRWLSFIFGGGMLLAVAIRAAGSVSGERARDTLSGLLATPLTTTAILRSKWIASLLYPRRVAVALALVWVIGLAMGAIHPLAVPCFAACWLIFAGFLAALGLFFSINCKTSHRATFWTVFAICVGLAAIGLEAYDLGGIVFTSFEAETVFPPLMLLVLPFSAADLAALRDSTRPETLRAVPYVLLLFLLATWGIWQLTCYRFRKQCNRTDERKSRANDPITETLLVRADSDAAAIPRGPIPWLHLALGLGLLAIPLAFVIGTFEWQRYRAHIALDKAMADADRLDPGWRWEEMESRLKEIPPEKNSALVLLKAHQLLPQNPQGDFRGLDIVSEIPPQHQFSGGMLKRLSKGIKRQQAALEVACRVTDMPEGRFPRQERDVDRAFLWYRSDLNELCTLLNFAAILRMHENKCAEAVGLCRAAFNCARSAGNEVSQMGVYVQSSHVNSSIDTLERILGLETAPDEELIAMQRLLEDHWGRPWLLQQLRGERATTDWLLQPRTQRPGTWAWAGQLLERGRSPGFVSPFNSVNFAVLAGGSLLAQRGYMLRYGNEKVEAAKLPEYLQDAAVATIEARMQRRPGVWRFLASGSSYWLPHLRYEMARVRCAIVALACERYRMAHGQWPARLQDLAPKFLEKLPIDPFNGAPLRFRRLEDSIVIYSVGNDRVDNGGILERKNFRLPGKDVGFQLWDPNHRRQPAVEVKTSEPDDEAP